jgi:hypothetical protein
MSGGKRCCRQRFECGNPGEDVQVERPATAAQSTPLSIQLNPNLILTAHVSEREAHAAQHTLEMDIGSQGVHPGIHPGPNQSIRPLVKRLFQPLQSLIRLA